MDLDLIELNRWLDGFLNFEHLPDQRMLKLETMRVLGEKFGHPEQHGRCLHVAGSKGKGTIAANIAGILRMMGYKTGVYASPHAQYFTERVGTGAGVFAEEVYMAAFCELKTGVEELLATGALERGRLTWFELVTMFGMLCFRRAEVDFAIYEVGMGGRLDATNIIQPECCVFGPIELEHTRFLGESLGEIATEKAGILKPGAQAVSAWQEPEAQVVLRRRAQELGAEIEFLAELGDYDMEDKIVALRAVEKVFPEVDREWAWAAMTEVRLPGRFEKICRPGKYPEIPYLLCDGAHTVNSMRCVLKRLRTEGLRGRLIFGCAEDKNVEVMAKLIAESGLFGEIYLTRPGDFKQADMRRMTRAFRAAFREKGTRIVTDEDYRNLIKRVLVKAQEDKMPVVALGSFCLVGEVKKFLN